MIPFEREEPRTPFGDKPRSQQAGMLCKDATFQKFVAWRMELPDVTRVTPEECREHILFQCGVESRKWLDWQNRKASHCNRRAADLWDELRTEYDAWRGKIAAPR
ncbi:hypothetical protein ACN2XU_02595 [Primorskyibacter sp. 2E107]|uniref:hypothetical protein n=1 Tax=Primorskyibacter sp. 2E107 TaxID=3403458 RepID=UPI003AF4D25B